MWAWEPFLPEQHLLMQPGTFQLTYHQPSPRTLYQLLRNPLAGNPIHTLPGRKPQPQQINTDLPTVTPEAHTLYF